MISICLSLGTNRTILELKQGIQRLLDSIRPSTNRTILELKLR